MTTLPLTDYHVHLSKDLPLERAVALATERQMKYCAHSHQ